MSAPAFDLARALRELARDHLGWHGCGERVRRGGTCPKCGPTRPESLLLLADPRVARIWRDLDSADRAGRVRERVRDVLESGAGSAEDLFGGKP